MPRIFLAAGVVDGQSVHLAVWATSMDIARQSKLSSTGLPITVGTTITGCPPYRPGRALISASGSYLG